MAKAHVLHLYLNLGLLTGRQVIAQHYLRRARGSRHWWRSCIRQSVHVHQARIVDSAGQRGVTRRGERRERGRFRSNWCNKCMRMKKRLMRHHHPLLESNITTCREKIFSSTMSLSTRVRRVDEHMMSNSDEETDEGAGMYS